MDKLSEFNSDCDLIEGLILPAAMFGVYLEMLFVMAVFRLFILRYLPVNYFGY